MPALTTLGAMCRCQIILISPYIRISITIMDHALHSVEQERSASGPGMFSTISRWKLTMSLTADLQHGERHCDLDCLFLNAALGRALHWPWSLSFNSDEETLECFWAPSPSVRSSPEAEARIRVASLRAASLRTASVNFDKITTIVSFDGRTMQFRCVNISLSLCSNLTCIHPQLCQDGKPIRDRHSNDLGRSTHGSRAPSSATDCASNSHESRFRKFRPAVNRSLTISYETCARSPYILAASFFLVFCHTYPRLSDSNID
jgi:hypothetical protein